MAREAFVHKAFSNKSMRLIEEANLILSDYFDDGYTLTLRQLHYQLFARATIILGQPYENTERSYKRLGDVLNDGRLAGLIDWDMIEDRGRQVIYPAHWNSPGDIARAAYRSFRIRRWADQPNHVEVMVEKQALEGILSPICEELDVRLNVNKGYSSASAMYECAQRIGEAAEDSKAVWVLYLGDHDPSGLQMTEDVERRLTLLSRYEEITGDSIHVERLALNIDQIKRLNLPPNPAKQSDSRFQWYADRWGEECWELDAIEPKMLVEIVRDAIENLLDRELWNETLEREEGMRTELKEFADRY